MKKLLIVLTLTIATTTLFGQSYRDSLVAYWSFEDSTARDYSGNGYHGTMMNNPTPVLGVRGIGTAMSFKSIGTNDAKGSHILLPMIPFSSLGEFTISIWVREEDLKHKYGEGYIFFGDHLKGWLGIMNHQPQDWHVDTNYITFSTGAVFQNQFNKIDPLFTAYKIKYQNNWVHYVMTYNDGVLMSFRDGEFTGSLKQGILIFGNRAAIARHWWQWSTTVETSTRFTGDIDEVKIFKKALTPDEIKEEFNSNTCDGLSNQYASFNDDGSFNFIGSAKALGDRLRLTESAKRLSGAAWLNEPVKVNKGFEVSFSFEISEGSQGTCDPDGSLPGADGLALVIQSVGPNAKGDTDWGIGYHGIPNSIAIEFDTFKNKLHQSTDINDPNGNHISVQSDRQNPNSSVHHPRYQLGINSNIKTIDPSGKTRYFATIEYLDDVGELRVYFDDSPTGLVKSPATMAKRVTNFQIDDYIDLIGGTSAFIGFTASTGDAWEIHDIMDLSYCSKNECSEYSPTVAGIIEFCDGDSTELFAEDNYTAYKWYRKSNGRDLLISSDKSVVVKESGSYRLEVIDDEGCPGYKDFTVSYLPKPEISIIDFASNPLCEGDSVLLRADRSQNEYHWSTGETTREIYVKKSGTYKLEVMNDYGCKGSASIDIIFNSAPKPLVRKQVFGECQGDSVNLWCNEDYGYYEWYDVDKDVLLGNTKSIIVRKAGNYQLRVKHTSGCYSVSDIINIEFGNWQNVLEISTNSSGGNNTYDFGTLSLGTLFCTDIYIKNISDTDYKLDEAWLKQNLSFSVPITQIPLSIKSGETVSLELCFKPDTAGIFRDTLILRDICNNHIIALSGRGDELEWDAITRCGEPIKARQTKSQSISVVPNELGQSIIVSIDAERGYENELLILSVRGELIYSEHLGIAGSSQHYERNVDIRNIGSGVYNAVLKWRDGWTGFLFSIIK